MRTRVIVFVVIGLVIALVGGGVGGYFLGQNAKKQAVDQATESVRTAVLKEVDEKNKASGNSQSNASIKTEANNTCNADELQVSVVPGRDSGAGSLAYDIVLKNSGGRTCTLGGYPGVSLVNASGNQVGQPAERVSGYREELLTLAPGKSVKAVLRVSQSSNYGAGTCKDGAAKLRVYPPNDTGYVSASAPVVMWCPGMTISPVMTL